MQQEKRVIAILGSTGSIGRQTLDVISQHKELFEVELLTANNNADLLIEQALQFNPSAVVICNKDLYHKVNEALSKSDIKVFAGIDSACDLVGGENIHIVVASMVGFSGLQPTIAAIRKGKVIALANKETLVAAGDLISRLSREFNSPIIPVDSEHSAIFPSLQGERAQIEKILLTASGGPFRTWELADFDKITPKEALKHPNWNMGAKVTIDSATMMNKGLEVIEAAWLFNQPTERIEVVIHPQSIIHSMVQFTDGSIKGQMGYPDMRVPIQYAISYPQRINLDTPRIDLPTIEMLTFYKPDTEKFPCLDIAYNAFKRGGNAPCAISGANEIAVDAFLKEKIKFREIPEVIGNTIQKCTFVPHPTLDDIYATDKEARKIASEVIK